MSKISFCLSFISYLLLLVSFILTCLLLFFQCYMRALFNYDPAIDSLLPCPEIGLEFKSGDILQVRVNNEFCL